MRKTVLIAAFVVSIRSQPFPDVTGGEVWIAKEINWEKVPPDVGPKLESGSATLLYFRKDGRFGLMQCRLNKGPEYLAVSLGDGQAVYEGTWELHGDEISVKYHLTYRTVLRVGERVPGPEQSQTIRRIRRSLRRSSAVGS
jgi:hypothetical protein